MILVRDIFQVKFGKMKDAKALCIDMVKLMPETAGGKPRILTDVTGPYYTLVMESAYKDLSDYDASMRKGMGDPKFGELYGKFVPLVDSGSREIFTIVS